jgi:hypothetical protein
MTGIRLCCEMYFEPFGFNSPAPTLLERTLLPHSSFSGDRLERSAMTVVGPDCVKT